MFKVITLAKPATGLNISVNMAKAKTKGLAYFFPEIIQSLNSEPSLILVHILQ